MARNALAEICNGETTEFVDDFWCAYGQLAVHLEEKYGKPEADKRLTLLGEYFKSLLEDHEFVERLTGTKKKGASLRDVSPR